MSKPRDPRDLQGVRAGLFRPQSLPQPAAPVVAGRVRRAGPGAGRAWVAGFAVVVAIVVEDGTFRVKYPATVQGGRYIERSWDGRWGPSTNGDTTLPRLDLTTVDPAWVQHGTDEAWRALDDPEYGSTTISVGQVDGVRTCVRAVAHEDDRESRVDVDCRGRLVG